MPTSTARSKSIVQRTASSTIEAVAGDVELLRGRWHRARASRRAARRWRGRSHAPLPARRGSPARRSDRAGGALRRRASTRRSCVGGFGKVGVHAGADRRRRCAGSGRARPTRRAASARSASSTCHAVARGVLHRPHRRPERLPGARSPSSVSSCSCGVGVNLVRDRRGSRAPCASPPVANRVSRRTGSSTSGSAVCSCGEVVADVAIDDRAGCLGDALARTPSRPLASRQALALARSADVCAARVGALGRRHRTGVRASASARSASAIAVVRTASASARSCVALPACRAPRSILRVHAVARGSELSAFPRSMSDA